MGTRLNVCKTCGKRLCRKEVRWMIKMETKEKNRICNFCFGNVVSDIVEKAIEEGDSNVVYLQEDEEWKL